MAQAGSFNAVALGQITPGSVLHIVPVVGYAAAGLTGGLLAPVVAFGPSFGSCCSVPDASTNSGRT
jgi:chromate transporter